MLVKQKTASWAEEQNIKETGYRFYNCYYSGLFYDLLEFKRSAITNANDPFNINIFVEKNHPLSWQRQQR